MDVLVQQVLFFLMFVRLSFGSYSGAVSNSGVSSGGVSGCAVGSKAVFYKAIGSQRIYCFSIFSLVAARCERDSCESYEHEN